MYPATGQMPMSESMLMSARPEISSLSYAVAKLAGMQMCLAYNQQYGCNRFITVIPNSGYGPHDNFDSETGHVIASLMSKFHAAKVNNLSSVDLWGSGSPLREFVHVDDIADACIYLMESETALLQTPVNIGTGQEVSIKALADLIAATVDYRGIVKWDDSKPDGAPRKLLDSGRLESFGWRAKIELKKGLKDTYDWFVSHDLKY
jgi:GDP-L-fucose synthase